MNTEGLEPYHDSCMDCGCIIFHQLGPHWSPISCVLPFLVRFGSFACRGRFWLSPCRLCQALLSAPPPLVGFWPVVRPLFLFPCPFRVCPFRARCVGVGVFSFPLPFCVPPLVFRLSNFHLIFIVISFPFFSHFHLHLIHRGLKCPAAAGRVCETSAEM